MPLVAFPIECSKFKFHSQRILFNDACCLHDDLLSQERPESQNLARGPVSIHTSHANPHDGQGQRSERDDKGKDKKANSGPKTTEIQLDAESRKPKAEPRILLADPPPIPTGPQIPQRFVSTNHPGANTPCWARPYKTPGCPPNWCRTPPLAPSSQPRTSPPTIPHPQSSTPI